jgi:ribonucleoside-diphosphate reductase alpha chain
MYREAWERGLKTTYYLRTLNKSTLDSASRDKRPAKEVDPEKAAACSLEAMRTGGTCESCQ